MANANTYIGINRDPQNGGFGSSDFTIQGSAPSTDFGFWFNALDGNSNVIQRRDAIIALKQILMVLESNDIYTTEMEQ